MIDDVENTETPAEATPPEAPATEETPVADTPAEEAPADAPATEQA